jgi:type IV pilus assembly protein PilW
MKKSLRRMRGVTLVEMMVALALGLLIVGAAIALFASTRQVSRTTDNMSRLQEGARFAFELMSREFREAGSTPCGSGHNETAQGPGWISVTSMLADKTPWWANWTPVFGYEGATAFPGVDFGATTGARVAGTDAFELRSTQGASEAIVEPGGAGGAVKLKAVAKQHDLKVGDIGLACDYQKGRIFKVEAADAAALNMGSIGMDEMRDRSMIARLQASAWYIGQTGRAATGGRALFRTSPTGAQEMIDGVQDMQIAYFDSATGQYVDATAIADWTGVTAARITLTIQGPDSNIATNTGANADNRITRTFTQTVAMRNLMP